MSLTFAEFQGQVGEWSRRNFPANTPDDPFEGMVEEVGELAHARLKARQGIRGTPEEHLAKEKDAIGDVAVFLADWAERRGLNLGRGLRDAFYPEFEGATFADLDRAAKETLATMPDRTPDLTFRYIVAVIGELAVDDKPKSSDAGGLLGNLAGYCVLRGWSFAEIVEQTWNQVKLRDWRKHPSGPPAEVPDDFSCPFGCEIFLPDRLALAEHMVKIHPSRSGLHDDLSPAHLLSPPGDAGREASR